MKDNDYLESKEVRMNKLIHINLKIRNKDFMEIDTLRVEYLKEHNKLPSRSEMIRILISEALENRL